MHPKWNKKVTLDLDQLKATLKKSFCMPKRNISTVSISYLSVAILFFFSELRPFFFLMLLDCWEEYTTESYLSIGREHVSLGKRRNQARLA